MKKYLLLSLFLLWISSGVYAYTTTDLQSATYLSQKWYIVDNSASPVNYRFEDNVTRKEIMKVIAKIGGDTVSEKCEGKFSDVANDWGCKYIEWALGKWIIAANATFRPDDNITRAEAIKMILKVKWVTNTYSGSVWQENYMNTAFDKCYISSATNYNQNAQRKWIFNAAYNVENTTTCDPNAEIDDILGDLFDLF